MSLSSGSQLGPYEILARLGAGGMGEVYRARDSRMGREVAIKVSVQRFSERFEREVRLIASLNHPNICTLFDVGPDYLVMELIEGATLAERIREGGAIPIEESLTIARQIADALEAAHDKGIVHRDLKPGNIMVKPDGAVKVLDFGLAKVVAAPVSQSADSPTITVGVTEAGMILGTAAYMSPEQARGKPIDKRTDIWAFGCVLYEMLARRKAFGGDSVPDILSAVLSAAPDFSALPAATPPRARSVLRRCLEKDPRERLRDIGDARIWMRGGEEGEAPPSRVVAPRRALSWIVAACFALMLGVLATIHLRERAPTITPFRFEVHPPEKTRFGSVASLSPDGRNLVFSAVGADNQVQLWLRPLDSIEARPLPGTDGVQTVVWSPDSRFLAFAALGKLKRLDASGGPLETLCDLDMTPAMLGGAWSRDGVILFGTNSGGLYRVSSSGGAASPLTTVDTSRGERYHSWPMFLPDGRHFIYLRMASVEGTGMYLGSLDAIPVDKHSEKLVSTNQSPVYAPAPETAVGHLLFLRRNTLMAQLFDAGHLKLAGEPYPIAESIGSFLSRAFFAASANSVLAYRTGINAGGQPAWIDRQGKALGNVGEAVTYNELALSHNGTRAAGSRSDPLGNSSIWLIDLSKGTSTPFTFQGARSRMPIWSPDDSQIAFASAHGGTYNLYQKTATGAGGEQSLLESNEDKYPEDWSPDGRFLLYSVLNPKSKFDLWTLPLFGDRKPTPLLQTQFNESQGQFSPDGRWFAYTSDESGRMEVYVQPYPPSAGGGGKWMVSSGGGSQPRWRGNGKELFYVSSVSTMAVDVSAGATFQTGTPRPLFRAPFYAGVNTTNMHRYAVTADGQRFLSQVGAPVPEAGPITVVVNWTAAFKR